MEKLVPGVLLLNIPRPDLKPLALTDRPRVITKGLDLGEIKLEATFGCQNDTLS